MLIISKKYRTIQSIMTEDWRRFETDCLEFLTQHFTSGGTVFKPTGGSNSTMPDIRATPVNGEMFYIECKKNPEARAGQFVITTNEDGDYIMSPRSKIKDSELISVVNRVLELINNNKSEYENAGTTGKMFKENEISTKFIAKYYNDKKAKFLMTAIDNAEGGILKSKYVIVPISEDNIRNYFDSWCTVRLKGSGSTSLAKLGKARRISVIDAIINDDRIKKSITDEQINTLNELKLQSKIDSSFIELNINDSSLTINADIGGSPRTISISKASDKHYYVSLLASKGTKNMTVLFSIKPTITKQKAAHTRAFNQFVNTSTAKP